MDILVGCDPEIFVRRADNNELVSAHGLIPGTKKAPHKVEKGAVQVDGMALEFNIDPASSLKEFKDNINAVMGQMKKMVGDEYVFDLSPTAHFGKEMIAAQPQEASDLGCEPDFDAYTGAANPKPNVNAPFRTASGHIHIGWTNGMDVTDPDHIEACKMLTKQLDTMLAPLSRLWDQDNERRELYGKLGSFRPKSFGVEYRVLSNAWLREKDTISAVYDIAISATEQLLKGTRRYERGNTHKVFEAAEPVNWWMPIDFTPDSYNRPWFKFLGDKYEELNKQWCADLAAKQEANRAAKAKKAPIRGKKADIIVFDDVDGFGLRPAPQPVAAPADNQWFNPALEINLEPARPVQRREGEVLFFDWNGNQWRNRNGRIEQIGGAVADLVQPVRVGR